MISVANHILNEAFSVDDFIDDNCDRMVEDIVYYMIREEVWEQTNIVYFLRQLIDVLHRFHEFKSGLKHLQPFGTKEI